MGKMKSEFVPDLLMKKYALLKQEVWSDMQVQREHIKYLYLLLTALFGLYTASLPGAPLEALRSNFEVLTALSFLLTIISSYIGYHVLDGIYSMTLVSARMAIIEQKLNVMANTTLLCWESSDTIRNMFNRGNPFPDSPGFINPLRVLAFLQGFVSILLAICVPIYAAKSLRGEVFAWTPTSVVFWAVQTFSFISVILFWYISSRVIWQVRTLAFTEMAKLDYTKFTLQLPNAPLEAGAAPAG